MNSLMTFNLCPVCYRSGGSQHVMLQEPIGQLDLKKRLPILGLACEQCQNTQPGARIPVSFLGDSLVPLAVIPLTQENIRGIFKNIPANTDLDKLHAIQYPLSPEYRGIPKALLKHANLFWCGPLWHARRGHLGWILRSLPGRDLWQLITWEVFPEGDICAMHLLTRDLNGLQGYLDYVPAHPQSPEFVFSPGFGESGEQEPLPPGAIDLFWELQERQAELPTRYPSLGRFAARTWGMVYSKEPSEAVLDLVEAYLLFVSGFQAPRLIDTSPTPGEA